MWTRSRFTRHEQDVFDGWDERQGVPGVWQHSAAQVLLCEH